MRSASLLALPFLRGPRLWTQRGLRHRTQLGGLPNAGFRDEARDVLRGRYVEGRVPRRTLLRGDRLPIGMEDLLRRALLGRDLLPGRQSDIYCARRRRNVERAAVFPGAHRQTVPPDLFRRVPFRGGPI